MARRCPLCIYRPRGRFLLFNSFQFLVFFPIVCVLFFAFRRQAKWTLLLASYYFYMCWKPEYLILILVSTLVDYLVAYRMPEAPKRRKRLLLGLSLLTNLGILFFFTYFNVLNDSVREAFDVFGLTYQLPGLDVLLPVGISFYTFQTLSYTIDVYRGARPPEHNLLTFALYVAFFPQLVAGPIERSTQLLPQLREHHGFDAQRVVSGLRLMLWGFFKKVVIADNLAPIVDQVYGNPGEYNGLHLLIATYFFAYQIYCDFSGYSDIAIGSARVMGYDLMVNFRRPYLARSIREFWSRWHISLSTWFRDYLYIPLGGNRVALPRWYLNLMIVFVVSGFWHGANWTFAVWGFLHGLYLVAALIGKPIKERTVAFFFRGRFARFHPVFQMVVTFHLVLVAWIFFRANDVSDAFYILTHIPLDFPTTLTFAGLSKYELARGVLLIGLLGAVHLGQEHFELERRFTALPMPARWAVYLLGILFIELFGVYGSSQFIYFQF